MAHDVYYLVDGPYGERLVKAPSGDFSGLRYEDFLTRGRILHLFHPGTCDIRQITYDEQRVKRARMKAQTFGSVLKEMAFLIENKIPPIEKH